MTKIKVKEILERKERVEIVRNRVDHLPESGDVNVKLISYEDLESVDVELEEYEELLNQLLYAAEVTF